MATKDSSILAVLEKIAIQKHQELIVNLPVREYNEQTYPNFLAFTNAVRMAKELLPVSDEELLLCIKHRLVGVDHQIE